MWRYILIVTDQFTRYKETLNHILLIQTIYIVNAAEKRKKQDVDAAQIINFRHSCHEFKAKTERRNICVNYGYTCIKTLSRRNVKNMELFTLLT